MNNIFQKVKNQFKDAFKIFASANRKRAVETIEHERTELENIFAIIVFGSFIGFPSPPMHITFELMPYLEKELNLMLEKVDTANEPISDLFSIFDIG
jgi:hypothetical protein